MTLFFLKPLFHFSQWLLLLTLLVVLVLVRLNDIIIMNSSTLTFFTTIGKTTYAALLFGEMKLKGYKVEWAPEIAKELVWAKKFDLLDNQHEVSRQQYESFRHKADQVDYIITDGSLIHGLHYNRSNPNNICQIERTETDILTWFRKFRHLVIYLERDPSAEYDIVGRVHTHKEALEADREFIQILTKHQIPFVKLPANRNSITEILRILNEMSI